MSGVGGTIEFYVRCISFMLQRLMRSAGGTLSIKTQEGHRRLICNRVRPFFKVFWAQPCTDRSQ